MWHNIQQWSSKMSTIKIHLQKYIQEILRQMVYTLENSNNVYGICQQNNHMIIPIKTITSN